MAWIEVHQELREHKKLYACAEDLKIGRVEMLGTVISLWLWALDNAQDGSLEGVSDRTIARVCGWPEKKAKVLVEALVVHGWLDRDGDRLVIHDWMEYAGRLMERREKDRKRKRRGADSNGTSDGIPSEAHGSSAENPALPYPNRTLPYSTYISGGDGDRAREASDRELALIGLRPGEYPQVTAQTVATVVRVTDALFSSMPERTVSVYDRRKVFEHMGYETDGLLRYAVRASMQAGKGGNWNYIDGVLARLAARGITTEADAIAWDEEAHDDD